jgi:hypothetical protein
MSDDYTDEILEIWTKDNCDTHTDESTFKNALHPIDYRCADEKK